MQLYRRTRPIRGWAVFLAAGSAGLLLAALGFQYIGGLAPCELCIWQRWPHLAAVAFALLWFAFPNARFLALFGALAVLTSAGVGAFHVGVEQGWWQGLATCSGTGIGGLDVQDLLNPTKEIAAPVRCDLIAWSLFGISMAGWNMIVSIVLALLWCRAARVSR